MAKGIYRTITEQIAGLLRQEILDGDIEEDSVLREQELSDRFQVSRGTVRHAMMQLVREGLINSTPNIGMRVASRPSDDALKIIVKLREQLEESALTAVWEVLRSLHLDSWEKKLTALEKAASRNDITAFRDADLEFHRFFVDLYPDEHIPELWGLIQSRMMMRYSRLANLSAGAKEHRTIFEAVKNDNREKALSALKFNVI